MGDRNYRHRETKKVKKDKKKPAPPVMITTPTGTPEVIEKRRPPQEEP